MRVFQTVVTVASGVRFIPNKPLKLLQYPQDYGNSGYEVLISISSSQNSHGSQNFRIFVGNPRK